MRKYLLLSLLLNLFSFDIAVALPVYQLVDYTPLSKKECLSLRDRLGLTYCPCDNDYLAGAALACGHLDNLPSPDELLILGRKIYNSHNSKDLYGQRNDELMKKNKIWVSAKRIFYWTNQEITNNLSKSGKMGLVRMFDSKRSFAYYAPRDGSGYISTKEHKMHHTKNKFKFSPISAVSPDNVSDMNEYLYNDALKVLCVSGDNFTRAPAEDNVFDDKAEPNLYGFSRERSCEILCGKNASYLKTKQQNGSPIRICVQNASRRNNCKRYSGKLDDFQYVCECP